ncbi:MAG: hypothetical protein WCF30_00415 [Terracidiphilus sp.]
MHTITDKLVQSDIEWFNDSKKVEPFLPFNKRPFRNYFEITVVSSSGTASLRIRLTRMCGELGKLDSAMPTPRILWQFQTLRWDHGCVIAGYSNEEMPKE